MAYDGSIIIDTKIDGSGAQKGINGIKQSITKMASALGLVKVVSAGFQMLKNSVQSAFNRIDVMEQFDRTMTAITKDSNAASKALDDLRAITKGTAYGLDVAAKATQDFVTRGMDIGDATKRVEIWADAVAFYGSGTNEQLSGVMDALAKMSTKGKIEMEQLNRLFDVGIDAVGMYAKATGRANADVQDDLSKGKISTEEFLNVVDNAMRTGAGGVQMIAGAAKEAGASWQGSIDNMKAAITRGMVNIIDAIDDGLARMNLPSLREMIAGIGTAFETTLNNLSVKIPALFATIGPTILNVLDVAKSALSVLINTIGFLGQNINVVLPLIVGVATAFKTWEIAKKITTTIQKTTTALEASGIADGKKAIAAKLVAEAEKKKETATEKATNAEKNEATATDKATKADKSKAVASKAAATAENTKAKSTQTAAKAESQEKIEAVKSTATLTLKQAVVGVLTGQIKLATAAQVLFNTAVKAAGGPVSLLIGVVTGVVAIIGTLTTMLNGSSKAVSDGFGNIAKGAQDFKNGIEGATSHLSEFNTNLFASAEEQQNLQDNMDRVQQGITAICKKASDERRNYTVQELQQLEKYFAELRELMQKQMDIEKVKSNAVTQQALENAKNYQGSLNDYKTTAQEWIKTAKEQADKRIELAKQQSIYETALLNQQYSTAEARQSEAYRNELNNINARYNQEVADAKEGLAKVTQAYLDGYKERAELNELYTSKTVNGNKTLESIEKEHAEKLNAINSGNVGLRKGYNTAIEDENKRHNTEVKKAWTDLLNDTNEATQAQIGTMLTLAEQTALAGGQIDDNTKQFIASMAASYKDLGKNEKEKMKEMFDSLGMEIKENGDIVYKEGDKAGQQVFKGLTDGMKVESKKASSEITKRMKDMGLSISEGFRVNIESLPEDWHKEIYDLLEEFPNAIEGRKKEIINELWKYGINATNAFTTSINTEEARNKAVELLNQFSTATEEQKPALLLQLGGLGMNLGDSLITSLSEKEPEVQTKTLELLNQLATGNQLAEPDLMALFTNLGVSVPQGLIQSLAVQEPNVQNETFSLLSQIGNGVALEAPYIESLLSNFGLESSDALINTLKSKTPEVQMNALELLRQLKNAANDDEKGDIKEQLKRIGVAANDGVAEGIKSNIEVIRDGTTGAITSLKNAAGEELTNITPEFAQMLKDLSIVGVKEMDAYMEQAKVSAPQVEEISDSQANSFANKTTSKLQDAMNDKSIKVNVTPNVGQSGVSGHAYGGLVTKEQLSWLAEGNRPEIVIPLSSGMRNRGLELWEQAGRIMGINLAGLDTNAFVATAKAGIMAQQTRVPAAAMISNAAAVHNSSMAGLANEIREACKEGCENAKLSASVYGSVKADGKTLGEIVTPYVDNNMGNSVERKNRYG